MAVTGGLPLDTTGDLWLLWGTGDPTGVVFANRGKGSLYINLTATPTLFLWVKSATGDVNAWLQITFNPITTIGYPGVTSPHNTSSFMGGMAGLPGAPGTAGRDGATGAPAIDGARGVMGLPGVPGKDGLPGSAVVPFFAVDGKRGEAGFPGMRGADGAAGAAGTPGVAGAPGATIVGLDGRPGALGFPGPAGPPGPQGPAGGGGGSVTTIEKDLGSTPAWRGTFTIVDAAITATSKVLVTQAPGPYTGKGTRADEAEMDQLVCIAAPALGSAVVYWRTLGGFRPSLDEAQGKAQGPGVVGGAPLLLAPHQDDPYARVYMKVIGKVRGNMKFHYSVAA